MACCLASSCFQTLPATASLALLWADDCSVRSPLAPPQLASAVWWPSLGHCMASAAQAGTRSSEATGIAPTHRVMGRCQVMRQTGRGEETWEAVVAFGSPRVWCTAMGQPWCALDHQAYCMRLKWRVKLLWCAPKWCAGKLRRCFSSIAAQFRAGGVTNDYSGNWMI